MRRPRGWKTTEIPFAFALIGGDLVEQPPQRAAAQCRPEGGAGGEELPQGVPAVARPRPPLPPRHRAAPNPGATEWNGCQSSAVVLHSPVVTDLPIFFTSEVEGSWPLCQGGPDLGSGGVSGPGGVLPAEPTAGSISPNASEESCRRLIEQVQLTKLAEPGFNIRTVHGV